MIVHYSAGFFVLLCTSAICMQLQFNVFFFLAVFKDLCDVFRKCIIDMTSVAVLLSTQYQ